MAPTATSTSHSRRRPTSAPSPELSIKMVRSSSAEPAKATKRKGTRSVSTLTPSQLARKRANDREAQRAIRARTKEHIERLERELEDLKSKHSRDQTVQELLRRNKALEDELNRLKENMGVSMTSSPYSTPVYDDNLSTGSGAIPSPRTSPFPSGDYNSLPDYGQQYVPLPNNCESWANTVPCPVPSNVSSPSSSANTDDYNAGYIPTSVPTSMLPSSNNSTTNVNAVAHKDVKMEYEEVDGRSHGLGRDGHPEEANHVQYPEPGFRLGNPSLPPAPSYMHQQQQPPWNVYPVYYPQAQSSVH
ncbi:Fc.00g103330.m01.CDS01 [Cosmosporella sp. VM-42]